MKKHITVTALAISLALAGQVNTNAIEENVLFSWTPRTIEDVISSVQKSVNSEVDYVVEWGDTLSSIADALGMSLEEIVALNNIENPDLILAGSTLSFNRQANTLTVNDEITYSTDTGEEVESTVAETSVIETTAAPTTEELVLTQSYASQTQEVLYASVPEWTETTQAPVVETTAAPIIETTEVPEWTAATTVETTQAPVVETTQAPIIETTAATTVETTQAPVIETTAATTVETTQAPVIETTAATTVETTQAPVAAPSMSPQAAFQQISAAKGLTSDQMSKWSYIISKESGWNATISNSYSGAYGLPQALPGSKMASHGADWKTNPYTQLAWMYDYMVGRYGSIEGAYNHSVSTGWY